MSPRVKITLAAVLFSTGGAAIKWVGFDAWQLAAIRAGLALVTILALVPEARRGWSWRTLQSTSPLFILMLAPWLLGEHATRRDLVQMAVMGAGLVLFFFGLDRPSATAPDPVLGNVMAASCAVTWAFTLIGYRWVAARGNSVATAAASGNLTACVVALLMAWPLAAGRPADWATLGFLGVLQLGVPYVFIARAVPHLRALEVALFMLIEPVLNPVWAWLVHGETPGPATLVGGALILGATVLRSVVDARSPERPPALSRA